MRLRRKDRFRHGWIDSDRPIVTARLSVVPLTKPLDASYLALLDDDFHVVHHWPRANLAIIKRYLKASPRLRHAVVQHVGVLVRNDEPHRAIGFISVSATTGRSIAKHQIGIQVAEGFRNQGYITEALSEVVAYLEQTGRMSDVVIATSQANAAMIHICQKLELPQRFETYKHPDGTKEKAAVFQVIPPIGRD